MKLYDTPLAPNPRRVRYFLAEKGIDDIEIVPVSLMDGEHKQAGYLAKAGLANVPMLELDDGTCLTESLAICRYLESLHPEPNLFGRGALETARIEMWTRRAELMVAHPLMLAVRHLAPALVALEVHSEAFGARSLEDAVKGLGVLDQRLAESPWIAGERLTMADIVAFAAIDFARLIRFKVPESLVQVTRWLAAMRERPASQAGMSRPAD